MGMKLMWLLPTAMVAVISALGQVAMRSGGRGIPLRDLLAPRGVLAHPWWWTGLIACWLCGLAWAWVVTRIPLGLAVPVYTGTFFIAVALGSSIVLGESIGLRNWAGFLLIAIGIAAIVSGGQAKISARAPYAPPARLDRQA